MAPDGMAQMQRPEDGSCAVSATTLEPRVACITITGELDAHTTALLSQGLTAALQQDSSALIVDLEECVFIDSTALGALIEANDRLKRMGRRLALVAPGREVRRTLEITGLDRVLAVHDSRASALGGDAGV